MIAFIWSLSKIRCFGQLGNTFIAEPWMADILSARKTFIIVAGHLKRSGYGHPLILKSEPPVPDTDGGIKAAIWGGGAFSARHACVVLL